MHAAAHDELSAQCAFLDARLADLLRRSDGAEVMPAVQALVDAVRDLVRQADGARVRGDRAGYDAAARCLHSVAGQWADHPDYRAPRPDLTAQA
ncbi:hypothetical protein [Streptomyces sp. WAC06614]|uniref:hypothetical protein n=1 Tax=Streptomyces sp. WAC06614 TaxID=2487416 RepID=UPI000F7B6537|nr:hypothetical protein [Streptomyces sp. WAC06614]RSS64091.1 hypothetical protein EF918_30485 [Streptomyces sp. WAC06614]